ncbi:ring finger domain-containing protein [Fusarium austroafricanum]|uniref:Ring finger domain-containing protein n=1 Tax=Fusarium austroafricanum TaxID=2364996 RepID=A0A8H4K378_9HYPO|nr:ring finger domain-containing protein [Fusarium austroafricanum]
MVGLMSASLRRLTTRLSRKGLPPIHEVSEDRSSAEPEALPVSVPENSGSRTELIPQRIAEPESSTSVQQHQSPKSTGFRRLERKENSRHPNVRHADLGPDHCVMCGKVLLDATEALNRWLNSEVRVHLPCGHPFGHECLLRHLYESMVITNGKSLVDGREHRCPMGQCTSIQHQCSHLAIPTVQPPARPYGVIEDLVLPEPCQFCRSGPDSRYVKLIKHGRKMQHETVPSDTRWVKSVASIKRKWHAWRFKRTDLAMDVEYIDYLKSKGQAWVLRKETWRNTVIQPSLDRPIAVNNILRHYLGLPLIPVPEASSEMEENFQVEEDREKRGVKRKQASCPGKTTSVKKNKAPQIPLASQLPRRVPPTRANANRESSSSGRMASVDDGRAVAKTNTNSTDEISLVAGTTAPQSPMPPTPGVSGSGLDFFNIRKNIGPKVSMPEEEREGVVTFPEPPKDDPTTTTATDEPETTTDAPKLLPA